MIALPAVALADEPADGIQTQDRVVLEAPVEVELGDPIDVILEVTTDKSGDVAIPEQSFGPFEVLDKNVTIQPDPGGTTQTFTFALQLLCFERGAQTLGPIQVRVTTPEGELKYLESETKTVEIRSLLGNEPNAQLKPPTQPVVVEQDDYTLVWILGALLAMGIGALSAWLFLRWWRRRERPEPAVILPPPWEVALAELR